MRIRGYCTNEKCSMFNKEWNCDDSEICLICKQSTNVITEREESYKPVVEGFASLGKFSSLNMTKRKEELKKRSHEHYKKEIIQREKAMEKGEM